MVASGLSALGRRWRSQGHRRWSLDFVAGTLLSGRRFRILTRVDDFTRERLDLVVDTSLTGLRVARELDRIAELRRLYARPSAHRTGL